MYASDSDSLFTVDAATGVSTLVGSHGAVGVGIGGMEMANGTLYGISLGPLAELYTIDTGTGAATAVGPLNAGFVFEGGLAWDGSTMWGVNVSSLVDPTLFTVDLASGAGTIVGVIATGIHDFNGLAAVGGSLYGLDNFSSALWLIDTTNPASSVQVGSGLGGGITMGSTGGMADDIGYASGSNTLFSVDFSTGVGTPLSSPTVTFSALATPTPSPWQDLGNALAGTHGPPLLVGAGTLAAGDPVSLTLSLGLENAPATLVIGLSELNASFKGGVLVPALDFLILGLLTDGTGGLALASAWPAGIPSGFSTYYQYWISDGAGPVGLAASNGLVGTTP